MKKKLLLLVLVSIFTLLIVACSNTKNIEQASQIEGTNKDISVETELADNGNEVKVDNNDTENKNISTEEVVYQGVAFQIPSDWELKSNTSSQLSYYFDDKNAFVVATYTELDLNNMEDNFLNPEYESAFFDGFNAENGMTNIITSLTKINGYQSYKVLYDLQTDKGIISAISYAFPVNTGMCSLNFGKTKTSDIDLESIADKFVGNVVFEVASENK